MNVYDFDKTILNGDTTFLFCRFALARRPGLLLKLPGVLRAFFLMRIKKITKTEAKQTLFRALLPGTPDLEAELALFWQRTFCRVKPFYLMQKREDDVVVSASPEFLLRPACARLGVSSLISSRVDPKTGVYEGQNCDGPEKVRRFRALFPDAVFDFYSDSDSDLPMAGIALRAYKVKGDQVSPWDIPAR